MGLGKQCKCQLRSGVRNDKCSSGKFAKIIGNSNTIMLGKWYYAVIPQKWNYAPENAGIMRSGQAVCDGDDAPRRHPWWVGDDEHLCITRGISPRLSAPAAALAPAACDARATLSPPPPCTPDARIATAPRTRHFCFWYLEVPSSAAVYCLRLSRAIHL